MYKRIIKLLSETQRGGQRGMGRPDNGKRRRKGEGKSVLPIDQPVVKPKPKPKPKTETPVDHQGREFNPVGQTEKSSEKSSANLELIRKTIREREQRIKARKKAEDERANRRNRPNRRGSL